MPQRPNKVVTERRSRVADLYLEGFTQPEIAARVGISQSQVSRDLKFCSKKWQEEAKEAIEEIKAKDLVKLDRLERKYHIGWRRSIEKQKTDRTKTSVSDGKLTTESSSEEKTHIGDPRFLDGVLKCLTRRAEILGYDAPSKKAVDLSGDLVIERLPEDQLDEIIQAALNNQPHGKEE